MELDIKDQDDKNLLPLNHDATIQSDLRTTLNETKESKMPQIKLEEQEILNIKGEANGAELKPDLKSNKKTRNKPKKGKWLVKLYKLLKCKNCSGYFETKQIFEKHQKICQIAPIKEIDQEKLQVQENQNDIEKPKNLGKRQKCNQCEKDFATNTSLKSHIRVVHENIKYQCDKCEKEYSCEADANNHKRIVHLGERHKCNQCEKDFTLKKNMQVHINAIHKKVKHQCEKCDREFPSKNSLTQHDSIVHLGKRYKCNQCDKEFGTRGYVQIHIRAFHENGKYQCDECERDFLLKRDLKAHIDSIHLGIKYVCNQCNKSFGIQKSLNRHNLHAHEGKRYKCDKCDKDFTTPQMLKSHIRAKHEKKRENTCNICGETFPYYTSLQNHLVSIHKGLGMKLKCKFCDKQFTRKDSKNFHEKKHENIETQKVPCQICNQSYVDLRGHVLEVHESSKLTCGICDKGYFRKRNLDLHMRKKHGKDQSK